MIQVLFKMWICLFYLGTVLAVPMDEFRAIVHEGELSMNDDVLLKQIVPSGYSPQIISENIYSQMPKIDDKDNENFKNLLTFVDKGVTEKGLVFNIYDDDMRNAAISLFRILRDTRIYNRMDYERLKKWCSTYVNDDMFDYAKRLTSLYSSTRGPEEKFLPPFIFKPHFFINGETIVKAMYIKNNKERISDNVLKNYQVFQEDHKIVVNSNYSGWNVPLNGCDEKISYFKDDAMLNSYYYGVHLQHPFWMPNEELDEMNPKHAEHFYFKHQQLLARYRLEKEHLGNKPDKSHDQCEPDYNPYLYYENGLAFPTRSSILGDMRDDIARLKSIDIAIKECIYRGIVFMENGTFIKVTPDNYIGLMTKLVRANLDGVRSAKIVRSIFGYGSNGYPVNRSNPSPSLLHHPQTTLRDPVYWFLMERGLEYFSEYTNNTEPINISKYESDFIKILNVKTTKLVTNFEFNLVNLNQAIEGDKSRYISTINNNIYARQRRLNYLPFTFNITVETEQLKDVIVRLFLGPRCGDNCKDLHLKFFELDCYRYTLKEGMNIISWSPESSARYVSFNGYEIEDGVEESYSIFKFPRHLVLPKGLEDGLNLTAFVMITEDDSLTETDVSLNPTLYQQYSNEVDTKPLGFPFHKQADLFNDTAPNYRFFNVTIFHSKNLNVAKEGYFSPHLY